MTAADHHDEIAELNLREIIIHIDQMQADIRRKNQEYRLAPWQVFTTLLGTFAAFFAAGVAFAKLLGQ